VCVCACARVGVDGRDGATHSDRHAVGASSSRIAEVVAAAAGGGLVERFGVRVGIGPHLGEVQRQVGHLCHQCHLCHLCPLAASALHHQAPSASPVRVCWLRLLAGCNCRRPASPSPVLDAARPPQAVFEAQAW